MMPSAASRHRLILYGVFLVSGACTLVFELAWVRVLVLVFGTSVFAVSTVLGAFMAGLALGAALVGRVADRVARPLRLYALLELGIGLFGLASPFVLDGLNVLYSTLFRTFGGGPWFGVTRFLLCVAALLVPTTLMGGTLPVLVRHLTERADRVGSRAGALYAINTLGAAAGCALGAFLLLERAGVRGSIFIGAAANLSIAGVAFLLASRAPRRPAERPPAPGAPVRADGAPISPLVLRAVFLTFAVSGFTALAYEVLWTRALSVILRLTTTQSLSVILVAFLAGIALGGLAGARLADRARDPVLLFALGELGLGLAALASVTLLGAVPWLEHALGWLPSWWGHMIRLVLIAGVVMLAPTFLMGVLFPLAGRIHAAGRNSLGRRIGDVYAANTVGSVFGAFAGGFVLIPWLGTQRSIDALAWLNVLLGGALVLLAARWGVRARAAAAGAAAIAGAALLWAVPADQMPRLYARTHPRAELLFHEEGAGGTVTVFEFPDGHRILRVGGAGEVPTDSASIRTFRLLGNLPMLLHPDPERVLVIAFGGGITLAAAENHRPERIDCVEIVPEVADAAVWFDRYNDGLRNRLNKGRVRLIPGDGRNWLLRADRSYDVIISDSTHPSTADSWVLYTEEFYALCRRRLAGGGLFAQWLPIHGLGVDDFRGILRTVRTAFPHASLWLTTDYAVILGTPDPLRLDLAALNRALDRPGVRQPLAEVGLGDPLALVATLILPDTTLPEFTGPGRTNTDDLPYVSFATRARSGLQNGADTLLALAPFAGRPLDAWVAGASDAQLRDLDRRVRARRRLLLAEAAIKLGDAGNARRELDAARALDPGSPAAAELARRLERL